MTFEQRPKSNEHLGAGVEAKGGGFQAEETASTKDLSWTGPRCVQSRVSGSVGLKVARSKA